MLSTQRERTILELLQEDGQARVEALAARLQVTDETIRRALKRLEAQGLVTRVHGGALLKDWGPEANFAQRMVQNPAAKRRIAEVTAGIIPDGASVFLDVGSTTAYVAQALRGRRDLLVVTNSLPVAQALTGINGNRIFMAGGELRSHDGGAFGAEALTFVQQFRCSHAILSAAAIDAPSGFLLQDLREAEFSRAMLARAETRIVAADAAKFQRSAPIAIAPPTRFTDLVTDQPPPDATARMLSDAGVTLHLTR